VAAPGYGDWGVWVAICKVWGQILLALMILYHNKSIVWHATERIGLWTWCIALWPPWRSATV